MPEVQPLSTHVRENLKLAVPVMLSNLGHILMAVSDNIMVGHIDTISLAAAGLATVIFNVLLLFGIGVSYAITSLVAEAAGERNELRIILTLRHGLVINVINAVVLALVIVAGKNVLYHINQPEEVVTRSIPYLNIITFSLIPVMIFQSFKQFAEGLGNTRVALVVVMAANVINIGLNYVLIFGHLSFPAYGLEGAGWATFLSRVFMAIAIAFYVYYHPDFRKYRSAFRPASYTKALFRKMLYLGLPSGVQFIFEVAAFDFSLVMMGWLGVPVQAAHQIVINLASLSYMVTAGLAAAATVRVGYFFGSNEQKNVAGASWSLLGMGLSLMFCFALIFIAGRNFLPALYVNDPQVISIASTLLIIAGLFQLSDGAQVICNGALRGLQDVHIPSVFIFISYWVIGLPLGYWLAFSLGYGATGIWSGLLIGLTLTALAMFWRLKRLLHKQSAQIPVKWRN
jgi:multidrug resistance protein, MATE family